jgi:hypothetical protein
VSPSVPALEALWIADPAEAWSRLGFAVSDHRFCVDGVFVGLGGAGRGITAWALKEMAAREIDGLTWLDKWSPGDQKSSQVHPNGVVGIDHVVVVSPDFDRTSRALAEAGMPLRRVREAPRAFRQGFRRLGPAILELVEARDAQPGPARFWGLTFVADDLDALSVRLGDRLSPIRGAVQPGRRIASLRREAGVSARVAFMEPE